jgi:catechol-2,3-dioxygenase
MTHDVPLTGVFDERCVGLDHLAFEVADRDEMEKWVAHLDAKGVAHSGIIDIGFGPTVVLRDPDNIQLEFFVSPSPDEVAGLISEAESPGVRALQEQASGIN